MNVDNTTSSSFRQILKSPLRFSSLISQLKDCRCRDGCSTLALLADLAPPSFFLQNTLQCKYNYKYNYNYNYKYTNTNNLEWPTPNSPTLCLRILPCPASSLMSGIRKRETRRRALFSDSFASMAQKQNLFPAPFAFLVETDMQESAAHCTFR